jgi:hypothetical protein
VSQLAARSAASLVPATSLVRKDREAE